MNRKALQSPNEDPSPSSFPSFLLRVAALATMPVPVCELKFERQAYSADSRWEASASL